MKTRYLQALIEEMAFFHKKMAFVSGPRQSGKTTLARSILNDREGADGRYFNWDDIVFRRKWTQAPGGVFGFPPGADKTRPLVVLDEIHKAKNWKRALKGVYDTLEKPCDILVTGSARLNVYRRGGESLLGRYFHFRLHPFSVGEAMDAPAAPPSPEHALERLLGDRPASRSAHRGAFDGLLKFGGFPEPFLKQSDRFSKLWRRGRVEKLVREDLRDLSRLPELSRIEMLVSLLPPKVGGGLSIQSLREDLEVSFDTVKRWLNYLKELYYCFEIKPYSKSIPRSLKKEGKLYLWDWSEVEDPGPRFENLVASHLLKFCDYWTDSGEDDFSLHYLRDKQKREVDFLITRDRKPWLAVEAKLSDRALSDGFRAFAKALPGVPAIQLIAEHGCWIRRDIEGRPTLVASAAEALGCFL